ncbi:MAG: Fic family protein [Bradymonadales bacterium]|nr:Fic family protein [Bradymonadales bacterium]
MDMLFLCLDEHLQRLREVEAQLSPHIQSQIEQRFLCGWIYHDLSLEGWVFRDNEIGRALEGREGTCWLESQLMEKVQLMRRAIQFVAHQAHLQNGLDLEFIKEIHRRICSDREESAGHYRKDLGDSRVYRHDLIAPSAISYRLRRLVSFALQEADSLHPIPAASEIHRRLMEIFPFPSDNGIVARLALNFWLMKHGYPPVVFQVTDRHRYFDAYLSSNGPFQTLVVDSMQDLAEAKLRSLHGLVDEKEQRV